MLAVTVMFALACLDGALCLPATRFGRVSGWAWATLAGYGAFVAFAVPNGWALPWACGVVVMAAMGAGAVNLARLAVESAGVLAGLRQARRRAGSA